VDDIEPPPRRTPLAGRTPGCSQRRAGRRLNANLHDSSACIRRSPTGECEPRLRSFTSAVVSSVISSLLAVVPTCYGLNMSVTVERVEPLMRPAEVAERLDVSVATIYRLVDRGELKAHRLGSGPSARLRIAPAELERFLDNGTRHA
jgi:excisionase family DNA binding protein